MRAAFPGATILRPSIVFGPEDDFVNRFARMARWLPVLPVIRGAWRLQPVFAADLGKAIAPPRSIPRTHGGTTYELAGPNVTTMAELNRWVAARHRPPARAIARTFRMRSPRPMARVGASLPGAPMTWDQWLMLQSDSVADPALPGFERVRHPPDARSRRSRRIGWSPSAPRAASRGRA